MLKAKPIRDHFINLTNFPRHQFDELGFTKAERDYYRDALSIAVEALEKYANQRPHYMWLEDKTYIDDAGSFAREALSTIKESQS